MKKKILCGVLSLLLLLSAVSCGKTTEEPKDEMPNETVETPDTEDREENEEAEDAEDGTEEPEQIVENDAFIEGFIAFLPDLQENFRPGTAGSSLASVAYAAKFADLVTETNPEVGLIEGMTAEFSNDAIVEASERMDFGMRVFSIYNSMVSLFENGRDILNEAGYTPKCEEWNAETVLSSLDAMRRVAAYSSYAPIVEAYYTAIAEKQSRDVLMDTEICDIAVDCAGEKGLDGAGYYYKDLDGDGIVELLLGTIDAEDDFCGKLVFALYKLDDSGLNEIVFKSGERSRYYYAGENRFSHIGSNGATDSVDVTETYLNGELSMTEEAIPSTDYVEPDYMPFSAFKIPDEE